MTLASWISNVLGAFSNNPELSVLSMAQLHLQRGQSAITPLRLLSEGTYVDGLRLNYLTPKQYYRYMAELGFSKAQAKLVYFTAKTRLTPIELSTKRIADTYNEVLGHYNQPNPTEYQLNNLDNIIGVYRDEMYKLGYDKDRADQMFSTLRPIPTFSTILEWLAKEAFEPEVVERFGLNQDLPEIFTKLMTAIGVPENETRNYWVAHWNHLPIGSIGEIYKRFGQHRGGISTNDLINYAATPVQNALQRDNIKESDFKKRSLSEQVRYFISKSISLGQYTKPSLSALQKLVTDEGYTVAEYNKMHDITKINIMQTGDRNIELLNEVNSTRASNKQLTWDDVEMSATDYTEALKLHEIAPHWRNREIARTYSPLTFTTLQQLYEYGLYSDKWFLGRLRDYNYSKGDAEAMLKVWRRKYPYGNRQPYSKNFLKRLETGDISDADAKQALLDVGVPEADADFIVAKSKDKFVVKHQMERFTAIKQQARKKNLDKAQVRLLVEAAFPNSDNSTTMTDIIMSNVDGAFKRYNIRMIGSGLKDGKITRDEAKKALQKIRVLDEDIDTILDIYADETIIDEIIEKLDDGTYNKNQAKAALELAREQDESIDQLLDLYDKVRA